VNAIIRLASGPVVGTFENQSLVPVEPATEDQITSYGLWTPNYDQKNSDVTAFVQNEAAPCGDITKGCEKKLNTPMVGSPFNNVSVFG
jgi:hypothetical protein